MLSNGEQVELDIPVAHEDRYMAWLYSPKKKWSPVKTECPQNVISQPGKREMTELYIAEGIEFNASNRRNS